MRNLIEYSGKALAAGLVPLLLTTQTASAQGNDEKAQTVRQYTIDKGSQVKYEFNGRQFSSRRYETKAGDLFIAFDVDGLPYLVLSRKISDTLAQSDSRAVDYIDKDANGLVDDIIRQEGNGSKVRVPLTDILKKAYQSFYSSAISLADIQIRSDSIPDPGRLTLPKKPK